MGGMEAALMSAQDEKDCPKTIFCAECGRPLAYVKCEQCVAADLPQSLIRFGELVKPKQSTGEP